MVVIIIFGCKHNSFHPHMSPAFLILTHPELPSSFPFLWSPTPLHTNFHTRRESDDLPPPFCYIFIKLKKCYLLVQNNAFLFISSFSRVIHHFISLCSTNTKTFLTFWFRSMVSTKDKIYSNCAINSLTFSLALWFIRYFFFPFLQLLTKIFEIGVEKSQGNIKLV